MTDFDIESSGGLKTGGFIAKMRDNFSNKMRLAVGVGGVVLIAAIVFILIQKKKKHQQQQPSSQPVKQQQVVPPQEDAVPQLKDDAELAA